MLAQQRHDPAPIGPLAELTKRLQYRHVSLSCTVVLDALSPDDAHLTIVGDLSGEGFDHRRLADAGFTGEEDHLAPTLGGLRQRRMQLLTQLSRSTMGETRWEWAVGSFWSRLRGHCCSLSAGA